MTWHPMRKGMAVLTVTALIVGSASVAVADEGAAPEKPWKVTYNLSYEPGTHECAEGFVPTHAVGTLMATHMGLVVAELWDCVDFASGEIADGVVVYSAANQDELYGEFAGQLTAVNPDGSMLYELAVSYAGGTGRFSNATGTAEGPGLAIPESATHGILQGTLAGTIVYDASDRRH